MVKTAVVALGGNAIIPARGDVSYESQMKTVKKAAQGIKALAHEGYAVVVTHGNGPQVGNLLLQQKSTAPNIPALPMDVCGAMTQGEIGYMLQQQLSSLTRKTNVTLITRVLVDKKDKAFRKPSKPVGPFYQIPPVSSEVFKLFKGKGWRRVVASPAPLKIIEGSLIKKLLNKDTIVIASGGGGIPVVKASNGYKGIEAVIDKDAAAERLAKEVNASLLVILTDVSNIKENYGEDDEYDLEDVHLAYLKRSYAEGEYPEGTMGPKVKAAIDFLSRGGKKVIITSPDNLAQALKGEAGTIITK